MLLLLEKKVLPRGTAYRTHATYTSVSWRRRRNEHLEPIKCCKKIVKGVDISANWSTSGSGLGEKWELPGESLLRAKLNLIIICNWSYFAKRIISVAICIVPYLSLFNELTEVSWLMKRHMVSCCMMYAPMVFTSTKPQSIVLFCQKCEMN